MEFYIALTAGDHPVIPGRGGFRKARWARRGQGKRGGFRVIYFWIAFAWMRLHGIDLRQVRQGNAVGGGP